MNKRIAVLMLAVLGLLFVVGDAGALVCSLSGTGAANTGVGPNLTIQDGNNYYYVRGIYSTSGEAYSAMLAYDSQCNQGWSHGESGIATWDNNHLNYSQWHGYSMRCTTNEGGGWQSRYNEFLYPTGSGLYAACPPPDADSDGLGNNQDPYPNSAVEFQWRTTLKQRCGTGGATNWFRISVENGDQFDFGTFNDSANCYTEIVREGYKSSTELGNALGSLEKSSGTGTGTSIPNFASRSWNNPVDNTGNIVTGKQIGRAHV